MTADVHALTGAYALNAIPEFERAAFERHLAECEACALEVFELEATAARLGAAAAEAPPPDLKRAVMAQVRQTRQLPPVGGHPVNEPTARRSPWTTKVFGVAAAVLLAVSVSLGVALYQTRTDLATTQAQAATVSGILSAGDAKVISGGDGSGLSGTVVYSRDQGRVMLMASGVPAAPDGKTYQVWLMDGSTPFHSVGLVSPDSSGNAAIVDATGEVALAKNIGITVEPAGGSAKPSTAPVMQMDLTS